MTIELTRSELMTTTHEHAWGIIAHVHHAPIDENDPIAHTSFHLLRCACGAYTGFPESNYALVTPRFRQLLEEADSCVCRTASCGHPARKHRGPNGACLICGKECWS